MNLYVVETEDNAYLGTVELVGNKLVIRTGYAGHPVSLFPDQVESLTLASIHPDVD